MSIKMPSQQSLHEQFKELITLANKAGLYDAADFLRTKVEAQEAREDPTVDARLPRRR